MFRRCVPLVTLLSLVSITACAPDRPDGSTSLGGATGTTTVETTSTDVVPGSTGVPSSDPAVPVRPRTPGFGSSRLGFFSDCPDLLGYLRRQSLERVSAWGLGGYFPDMMYAGRAVSEASTSNDQAGAMSAPTTVPAYSSTNTQEIGVDEGDMVETNGTHVFVAGTDGVRIVEVGGARVIATLDVAEGAHQLLLDGARLLVATQPYTQGQETIVSLFDVADPARPVLLERQHLEGSLLATRAIDGMARLVLSSPLAQRLPFVNPSQFGLDEDRALAENKRIIETSSIADWMPRSFAESADGTFAPMVEPLDCSTVAAPSEFAGLGITWIATIDMGGDAAGSPPALRSSAGVVSQGGTVYASATNLYLATTAWDWYQPLATGATPAGPPPTLIHQFSLTADGTVGYVATGAVKGRLLNQFAMSELDGDLRVATTVDDWSGTSNGVSESFVQVLRPQGEDLVTIGSVGGLGLTEQIYAVRFLGSLGYVVTFRQTDPLYVIDLTDPTNPRQVGELKIPGYSAYLHPIGDGLLLGVGQAATAEGRTLGTQLSLFDVSNPAAPVQLATLPIGGSSDAEWDHKAFLYWPEQTDTPDDHVGTIVIPVSPWWGPCPPDAKCLAGQLFGQAPGQQSGGVVVVRLENDTLTGVGAIRQASDQNGFGCWNPLQRSMVIGDELVTIGFDHVQFNDRATLLTRSSARWGDVAQYGCAYYGEG